jgi:hypothetical protein
MIGGPVTAIPTMVLFWTIFKKRVFVLYMFVCLAGTILIASTFQWLVFVPGVDTGNRLFKSVSSLAGGQSSVIRKDGRNVRIALDPAGKNIIATYSNDLASHGGVVFDAGFGRFAAAASGTKDDRNYVANVASWLEQNGSSPAGRSILIYTVAGVEQKDVAVLTTGVADVLRHANFPVVSRDRIQNPQLTDKLLAEVGQLWLFFPEPGNRTQLTDNELKLVSSFNERGNGMMVAVGSNRTGLQEDAVVNRLSSRYGVQFSDSADNGPRIFVGMTSQLFTSASELLGRFLKIVHKA